MVRALRAWTFPVVFAAAGCRLSFGPPDVVTQGAPIEAVAELERQPTTVAVSDDGRLFVSFPNWWSQPELAVAELTPTGLVPYPDRAWNSWDGEAGASASRALVCVQAVHVDRCGRTLWVVDAGSPLRAVGGVVAGAPKLVGVDLDTDEVTQLVHFGPDVVLDGSYLNDVQIDRATRTAYLSDSGRGGLLVVDLESGRSRRVLDDHPATLAEAGVTPVVGGKPWTTFLNIPPRVHVDGLALDASGTQLYFHALSGRGLYRVPAALLRDEGVPREALMEAVESLGETSAVDGMAIDEWGNLYLTALEHDAIERRRADGTLETLARSARIEWPDAIAIRRTETEDELYFTTSKIHTGWPFNYGVDTRTEPFELLRIRLPLARPRPREPVGCPG